jgi:uncharacterized OB-fold protein
MSPSPAPSGFVAPNQDADSAPWWAAVADRRLLLPRCEECGLTWFPPTPGCPRCGSPRVELIEAAGTGRIYSWVVVNRALSEAFTADAPYTILTVDLDEGARMFGRLIGDPNDPRLRADARLKTVFYEVQEQTLVGFEFDQPR